MKKLRIVALLLAVVLMLTTAACGAAKIEVKMDEDQFVGLYNAFSGYLQPAGEDTPATPADNTPATQPTSPQPSSETPSSETPSNDTPSSEAPSGDTPSSETPASDTPATEKPANAAPTTKEEIVAYYVAAYNKMGTDAKTFTRTYDYTSNYKGIVEVNNNKTLESLAKTLMDQFMKETTTEVPGDFSTVPPVGVTNLVISPSQVGTAECVDNGSTYTITLTSTGTDDNPETDCQPGQGSAGVIGLLLRTEDVSGAATMIKFDGLHAYYPTGKVVATVDKASGHITELYFENPCILHFDSVSAFVVKINNANLGLLFQQRWKIGY